jgi:mannose/cellobiose epimerase-like protein (N-acyl-D-glucosamine 2-epimerase family)
VLEAEAKLVARSADMVDFCLQAARRPAGGFCIAVAPDGGRWPATAETSDLRPWWVQIEALHTLHLLAGHEAIGRADRIRYWQARDEQWAFVRSALSDEEYRGIRTLALDPTPRWTRRLVEWLRGPSSSGPPLRMRGWHDLLPEVATFLAIAARP